MSGTLASPRPGALPHRGCPRDTAGAGARRPELVVAVDGSPASLAAVDWAAREAMSQERRLRLVNVVGWPYEGAAAADAVELSAEVLAEAAARASATGVQEVVPESRKGKLGPLLLEISRQSHTVVLGHRPTTGFAEMVLRSVSVAVASHAEGPVIVVPEPVRVAWYATRPLVVVGVDGAAGSGAAVSYAFDHAGRHGCEVEAVVAGRGTDVPEGDAPAAVVAAASRAFPAVPWRIRRVPSPPVEALTGAAAHAALLVVGCRSRLGQNPPLVDSVSRGALFLSRCPVAVV